MTNEVHTIQPLAFPVLMGDIGGTNARFSILEAPDEVPIPFDPVPTAEYPDIESAIQHAVLTKAAMVPKSAVIALAGPIDGDEVDLTNAHWVVKPRDLMAKIGLSDIVLLNDFEAQALALTALDNDDIEVIGSGHAEPNGPQVVLGPGTGLGVAALVRAAGLWVPIPGEGGHIAIGPDEPDEFDIWPHIEPELGRISAEALLAGRGIVRLYRAIASCAGVEPAFDDPSAITEAALSHSDLQAVQTVELYCRLLGRVAGDFAVTFMASGGVTIGGGIAPRLLKFLKSGGFRTAFEKKAPHEDALIAMRTAVITHPRPAMKGMSAFASHPERYGVDLEGRRWNTSSP